MSKPIPYLSTIITTSFLLSCGGGDSNSSQPVTIDPPPAASSDATFTLGISDAPVDNADEVVITIESITFKKDSGDVVFDTFSNESEGIENAETITLDLLQFQGSAQFNVLENVTIEPGEYSQIFIEVLDEDIELSYVTELDGAKKSIKVPSDNLKLGGITFAEGSETQLFTVEFNLRHSMTYKPGPQEYNLKPRGVRIVDNGTSGTISGTVDMDTINTDVNCMADTHLVYLFEGDDLNLDLLADNFDAEVNDHGAPEGAIAPIDTVEPSFDNDSGSYRYEFGFVNQGEYTLVYACNTGENGDDPELYDGIMLPNPSSEIISIELDDEDLVQNFPIGG